MFEYMQDKIRKQYEKELFESRKKRKEFKYLRSVQRDTLQPVMESEASNGEAVTDEHKARIYNEFCT